MNQELRWHLVFTRPHSEQKVALALSARGYHCYCPQHFENALWKSQEKNVPLFNSYVFIQCTPEHFADIKKTPGIINFMYRLNQPAVITNDDMATIRQATGNYRKLQVVKTGWQTPLQPLTQEDDNLMFPLQSLGLTIIAAKESLVNNQPVLASESKRSFPRLSYRFRVAWR
jgi:transcription antitermination factor NusG